MRTPYVGPPEGTRRPVHTQEDAKSACTWWRGLDLNQRPSGYEDETARLNGRSPTHASGGLGYRQEPVRRPCRFGLVPAVRMSRILGWVDPARPGSCRGRSGRRGGRPLAVGGDEERLVPRLQVYQVDQYRLHSGVAFLVTGQKQFREDGVDMFLHSLAGDEQGGSDCGVGLARGHRSQNFCFSGRQRPLQPALSGRFDASLGARPFLSMGPRWFDCMLPTASCGDPARPVIAPARFPECTLG